MEPLHTKPCDVLVEQELLVSRNLPRRSVASVRLSRSRTRLGPRPLGSRNRRSAAKRSGRQRQPSGRSRPLRSGARQRHCLDRRLLHLVRRRLQLSVRLRPLRSVRHRRLPSEHRRRRLRLGRQLLRSEEGRYSGRVRLRSVQVARQPLGARRRHHLLVSVRVVAGECRGHVM